MKSKIKVRRDGLIDAIRERKREAIAAHEEDVRTHPDRVFRWKVEQVDTLRDALHAAEGGREVSTYSRCGEGAHYLDLPDKPSKPGKAPNTDKYDRDIKVLEMTPDETISIYTEDYERYVR